MRGSNLSNSDRGKNSLVIMLMVCAIWAPAFGGTIGSYDYRGQAELGGRDIEGNGLSSSKFNEYRDLQDGFFMDSLEIYLDSEKRNHYLELQMFDLTRDDQRYSLSVGRHGRYKFQLTWDAIPHAFSNQAKTLFTRSGAELLIPDSVQSDVEADETTLAGHLKGAHPFDLDIQRKKITASLDHSPTPDTQISMKYWIEERDGVQPVGTTRFFEDMINLPAPVNYRTQNFELKTEYATKTYQLQLGYSLSAFDDKYSALVWDNIFSDTDAVGDSSRGRLTLYPDNMAQSISFNGAYNLPFYSTRLFSSFSYGWWVQNEDFLPYTINPAIPTFPLPARSLGGEINPMLLALEMVTRPHKNLTLKGRYRLYDLNNSAKSYVWDYVSTDNLVVLNNSRINLPAEYRKENLDISAAYNFTEKLTGTLFYGLERWDRKHREVEDAEENRYGAKLDFKPHKRVLMRASYAHSLRDLHKYSTEESVDASFPLDPSPGFNKILPELRKYDQAERERDEVRALIQIAATKSLDFSVSYNLTRDDYHRSAYGLLNNNADAIGIDFAWAPHERFSLHGLYTHEIYQYDMKSRLRIAGFSSYDIPVNDWVSSARDRVDTYLLGANVWLIKDKLDMETSYINSFGSGFTHTRALGDPTDPLFLVTTAVDYPKIKNRLQELEVSFRYSILENLSIKVGYALEKYSRADFQTAGLAPLFAAGPTNMVTLNEIAGDYEAHLFSSTLNYKF